MTLVFVYNADSGFFNALLDSAHKTFSPETYQCNLCAITYSNMGMRKAWKTFLDGLDVQLEFLHRDELKKQYHLDEVKLPAIFTKTDQSLQPFISADEINRCDDMESLQQLILTKERARNNLDS